MPKSDKYCDRVTVGLAVEENGCIHNFEVIRVDRPDTNGIASALDCFLEMRRRQRCGEGFAANRIRLVNLTLWSRDGEEEGSANRAPGAVQGQQPELPFGRTGDGAVADPVRRDVPASQG